jgi:hypothetical protein
MCEPDERLRARKALSCPSPLRRVLSPVITVDGVCALTFLMTMYALEQWHVVFVALARWAACCRAATASHPGRGRSGLSKRSGRSSLPGDIASRLARRCSNPHLARLRGVAFFADDDLSGRFRAGDLAGAGARAGEGSGSAAIGSSTGAGEGGGTAWRGRRQTRQVLEPRLV